ncbi:energy transducer TonB [Sphingomicrobium nitratireducens]|uniref:energy transducer TonB n=1 Tax=Sphingomicrobium nitratireducens TaxID=2964666 RepID=UPI00223FF24E|nr:TonB family protein [Sphingomicrobium nitratireducens]
MYRNKLGWKDRAGSIALVVGLHVAVAAAALTAGGVVTVPTVDEALQTFDVIVPEPPPPIIEEIPEPEPKAPREEGAASAKNIESDATPVEAPKPVIKTPTPNPIVASPTPNEGNDPTQGASDVKGEGTGAGGSGTGTGSGSGGDGKGGGGGTRPSVINTLRTKDYPKPLRAQWNRAGPVFARFWVDTNGRASQCRIDRSSGNPAIDAETCRLVETRVRFRPATDASGKPYGTWYGYIQRPL